MLRVSELGVVDFNDWSSAFKLESRNVGAHVFEFVPESRRLYDKSS